MQLTPSETFVSGELYIASSSEQIFTLEAKLKANSNIQYLQAQMDLIFWTSDESKIKTKKYTTYVKNGVNISMNHPIITRKCIPMSKSTVHASSLLVRLSINGIQQTNGSSIHPDQIEIKVSKKEVNNFIARMPHGYAAGYDKMKKQHLKSKNGQLLIPELADVAKKILIKKKQDQLFYHWYSSKRKVFDKSKYVLIPKRKNRVKTSKWNQYQSTIIHQTNSIAPTTVPDFEPTEEEILYQMQKQENQCLISKWKQENKTKPECDFLVVPSVQDQMRMKIIKERENVYQKLKKRYKIKGILKIKNQTTPTKTRKKITFNLNKNKTIICARWINQ